MKIRNEELIKFCRELVRIPSYPGEEKEAVVLIQRWMKSLGFDEIHIDAFGSILGKINGTGGGKTVLLDGHVDTVGIGSRQDWKHDPFGADIENGRIYGRGTSDMKGALAAMIYAASRLTDERPAGDVYVSGTVFEEKYEGVALRNILRNIHADYVIVGEASELDLKTGQKGRAEIKITTHGKSGHAAHPEDAVNAVYKMQTLIGEIRRMDLPVDAHLGPAIMELTDIISSPYPGTSVIPSECTVTYDRRLVEGETRETVIAHIQAVIEELRRSDPEFSADIAVVKDRAECYTGAGFTAERFFPAWYYDREAPFVRKALSALRAAGINSSLATYTFCTNASASAGELHIPSLGFGPSRENQAHVCDEYIEIEQLVKAAHGYAALARTLSDND